MDTLILTFLVIMRYSPPQLHPPVDGTLHNITINGKAAKLPNNFEMQRILKAIERIKKCEPRNL